MSEEKSGTGKALTTDNDAKRAFYSVKLGIWEIIFPIKSGRDSRYFKYTLPSAAKFLEILSIRLFVRLLKDMYSLAPLQLIIYVLFELGQSLQGGITLYLNSQILDEVSFPNI